MAEGDAITQLVSQFENAFVLSLSLTLVTVSLYLRLY